MSDKEETQEKDVTFWVLLVCAVLMAFIGLYIYLTPCDTSYFPTEVSNFSTAFDSGSVFNALS